MMAEHLSGSHCVKGVRQGCVFAFLLSITFFTAVLNTVEKKFMEDPLVVKDLVSIVTNAACEEGRESLGLGVLWNMLYADDAGIVSRSKNRLAKIMSVVVET